MYLPINALTRDWPTIKLGHFALIDLRRDPGRSGGDLAHRPTRGNQSQAWSLGPQYSGQHTCVFPTSMYLQLASSFSIIYLTPWPKLRAISHHHTGTRWWLAVSRLFIGTPMSLPHRIPAVLYDQLPNLSWHHAWWPCSWPETPQQAQGQGNVVPTTTITPIDVVIPKGLRALLDHLWISDWTQRGLCWERWSFGGGGPTPQDDLGVQDKAPASPHGRILARAGSLIVQGLRFSMAVFQCSGFSGERCVYCWHCVLLREDLIKASHGEQTAYSIALTLYTWYRKSFDLKLRYSQDWKHVKKACP